MRTWPPGSNPSATRAAAGRERVYEGMVEFMPGAWGRVHGPDRPV